MLGLLVSILEEQGVRGSYQDIITDDLPCNRICNAWVEVHGDGAAFIDEYLFEMFSSFTAGFDICVRHEVAIWSVCT